METEGVIITVDEKYLDQIRQVAEQLREAGLKEEKIHDTIGIITGRIEPSKRRSLENVTGVVAIEDEQIIQIPPFDKTPQNNKKIDKNNFLR